MLLHVFFYNRSRLIQTSHYYVHFSLPLRKSPYIFSKLNPLNTGTRKCGQLTLVSCPINRFSQKVNLANADSSLSTVCCNKPFL